MKYTIPEEEKSKLRLFNELPKDIRPGAAVIRETSTTWEDAKNGITTLITDGINKRDQEITDLRAARTLLNSSQPVGPQRENDLQCYPDRRKDNER